MGHGDRETLHRDKRPGRQIGDRARRQDAADQRANDAVVAPLPGEPVASPHHDRDGEQNPVAMPLVAKRLRDQRARHHRKSEAHGESHAPANRD